jgi:hypothetical protein
MTDKELQEYKFNKADEIADKINPPWNTKVSRSLFTDAAEMGFDCAVELMRKENEKLVIRIEGMILSLQTHGQNIDVKFHIDWLDKALKEYRGEK